MLASKVTVLPVTVKPPPVLSQFPAQVIAYPDISNVPAVKVKSPFMSRSLPSVKLPPYLFTTTL